MNKNEINSTDSIYHSPLSTLRSKIGLILLAAGASNRLENFPKQLLEYRGKTLLRHAAETALACRCRLVCLVLGANAVKLQAEIADLPLEITVNQNWENGLSSSLQAGLQKLLEFEPEISAVCVMLVDQPLVTSAIINNLIDVFERGENVLVVCQYAETIGVPVILARVLFDEVRQLTGDSGAKKIIQKHIASAAKISVPEAALDIDLWDDYAQLKTIE